MQVLVALATLVKSKEGSIMHIPDGYLAPAFSVGMGVFTAPPGSLATRRVKQVLNQRTVPLLAIFAAFSFTIMMFNVPVPGGTTAHGVGGTLVAIVLGPAAAVIVVSTALIIQALFFGDGGILAIFANCFNMGVLLPFVGYYTYRLIAGRAPLLSTRRVWAAGIGAYVGITVAALAVGIELGVQPGAVQRRTADRCTARTTSSVAVPAMLLAHMFGASIVEAHHHRARAWPTCSSTTRSTCVAACGRAPATRVATGQRASAARSGSSSAAGSCCWRVVLFVGRPDHRRRRPRHTCSAPTGRRSTGRRSPPCC